MTAKTTHSSGDGVSFSASSELTKLLERAADLQRSVDTWNRWYVFSLGLVIIAAIAVGVTNRFVIARQRRKAVADDAVFKAKEQQFRAELHDKDLRLRRELDQKDRVVADALKDKDVKIGEAYKLAGIANNEAGLANERAAHANEEAARLSRDAEELKRLNLETEATLEKERVARIGLEQSMAPRVMIRTGGTNARLSRFGGTRARVEVVPGDNEALRAAESLYGDLKFAGWNLVAPVTAQRRFNTRAGVDIMVDGEIPKAANDLAEFLLANHVDARVLNDPHLIEELTDAPLGGVIAIRVGIKPQPYFFLQLVERVLGAESGPDHNKLAAEVLEDNTRDARELQDKMNRLHREWYPSEAKLR